MARVKLRCIMECLGLKSIYRKKGLSTNCGIKFDKNLLKHDNPTLEYLGIRDNLSRGTYCSYQLFENSTV